MPRLLPTSGLLFALLAMGGVAAAQGPPSGADTALQVAVGKALLEEGKKLLQDGRLDEARQRLEVSVQRDPTPEALLVLGACQEKLGATASAWGTYHRAEKQARTLGDTVRAQQAAARTAAIEPRLSRVRILVGRTGPLVVLDDRGLAREAWGVPLPLDPGPHRLAVTEGGKRPYVTGFEVTSRGEIQALLVPDLAPYPPAPPSNASIPPGQAPAPRRVTTTSAASPPDPVPSSTSHGSRPTQEWIGAGLLIGGGVNFLGSAFALDAIGYHMSGAAFGGNLVNTGLGLATGTLGLALVATASRSPSARAPLALRVTPIVAGSTGGLSLHGTF